MDNYYQNDEINAINIDFDVVCKDDFMTQFEKEKRQDEVINNLIKMYESIFESHQKGNLVIYNPNICLKLTVDKFISWAIANNPELSLLFQ